MATYTILGEAPARRLVATNMMPSRKEDIDSYWSKLGGLYRVIATVEQVLLFYDISNGQIKVGSDCLVGLQQVFMDWGCASYLKKHHNLVSAMRKKVG